MKYPFSTWLHTICIGILITSSAQGNEYLQAADPVQTKDRLQVSRPINEGVSPNTDFAPIPLERLIGIAELIVIGTVEAVEERQISIRVDEALLAKPAKGLIVIKQGEPSGFFPPRLVPYERGQQFLFFLVRADEQKWLILGNPIAGELPVEAGFVYFDSYDLKSFSFEPSEVHGEIRPMQRFDLNTFTNAVKAYRDCFSWTQTERVKNRRRIIRWVPVRKCDDMALRRYRAKSGIHEYLSSVTTSQVADKGQQ